MSTDPHKPGSGRRKGSGLLGAAVREVASDIADTARLRRAETATGLRRAWARRPSLPRALAWLFLAGSVGTGALTAAWPAFVAHVLPSPSDWAAARALLERDARPGDAIVLSPAWAERAREVLPAMAPVLAAPALAGDDLPGVRRVWVVSLPHVPPPPGEGAAVETLGARSTSAAPPVRLGALEVRRHDLADPLLPLAFLPDLVGSLSVRLGGEACPGEGGGFRCGSAEGGVRLERTLREVGGVARPCLAVALPAALPAPLALRFPGVPVGRFLRGHAGIAGARRPGARLSISVLVGGEEAGAVELEPAGFVPFQVDTVRFAGRAGEVTLVLTAAGPVGDLCLDGMTIP